MRGRLLCSRPRVLASPTCDRQFGRRTCREMAPFLAPTKEKKIVLGADALVASQRSRQWQAAGGMAASLQEAARGSRRAHGGLTAAMSFPALRPLGKQMTAFLQLSCRFKRSDTHCHIQSGQWSARRYGRVWRSRRPRIHALITSDAGAKDVRRCSSDQTDTGGGPTRWTAKI